MHIDIHGLNIQPTDAMRIYMHRRIQTSLDHLHHAVRGVVLRIKDINGPRGGVNKRCQISVQLTSGERIFIEDIDEDVYRVVDRITTRTKHTIARFVARRRDLRRRAS